MCKLLSASFGEASIAQVKEYEDGKETQELMEWENK